MYAVVVGGGVVGMAIARWLVGAGYEVVVVERDAARRQALEKELGSVAMMGDGTETEVLTRAGVSRADVFIAVTGRDDQNLAACQLAKHRFNAGLTMALAGRPDHRRLYELAGVDIVLDSIQLVVDRVEDELRRVNMRRASRP